MSISQSKLANDPKQYKGMVEKLDKLQSEGRELGAVEGAKRIEFICDQYKHLSPNTAYAWLNPNGMQDEIVDAQAHTALIERIRFFKHVFSLAPLIMTWFALFMAMGTYSQYITNPKSDHQSTFLSLWLSGFHGQTWFTFTATAEIDVFLLCIYLGLILFEHTLENRARTKAVSYTTRLQGEIGVLMQYIATEGLTLISDQSDVDRAIDSIKDVVKSTSDALTAIVEHTVKEMNTVIATNFLTFKQHIADTEAAMKLYIDGTTQTQKVALASVGQTMQNVEQAIKTHIDTATGGQKLMLVHVEDALKTLMSNTQDNVKQAVETATLSVTENHQRVEKLLTQTIEPMMTDFHTDMQGLHIELAKYQGRLDGLTDASQKLAGASQGLMTASSALVDNAEAYIIIGQDIGNQIGSLNATQQEVLVEIQQVSSGITTVAGSLSLATSNMVNATNGIEQVVDQINTNVTTTTETLVKNVDQVSHTLTNAARQMNTDLTTTAKQMHADLANMSQGMTANIKAVARVEKQLEDTTRQLQQVASVLASIQLPWFFKRKSAGTQNRAS